MTVQKRVSLVLGGLLLVAILGGCVTFNPGYRPPAAQPQTPAQFTADLIAALVNRDVETLQSVMSDPFIVAIWQGEASEQTGAAALGQLESELIGPASSITFVSNEVVVGWLGGVDPLSIWPEGVNAVSSVGISGLGAEGRSEAILIIAQAENGSYSWQAALIAVDGFAAAGGGPAAPIVIAPGQPPLTFLPTDVSKVLILGTIGIFDGPGATFNQIGLAFRGETYAVLGVSADAQWWAVRCSFSDLPCWIGANPTFVRPVDGPPPAAPTSTPRPTATPLPPTYPIRIQFAPGQSSTVVRGNISPGFTPQYVLFVRGGQTLRLLVDSPSPSTNFSVRGVSDGVTYKAGSDPLREWSMLLPRTQDYLITLTATVRTSYILEVTVSQSPTPPPVPTPERISFGQGETSAVRNGALPTSQLKQYIFRAQAGQQSRVLLSSPGGAVNFSLQGVTDGVTYKPFTNPAREFSLTLPRTQDYLISLSGPAAINYTLELTVLPLGPTPTPTTPPAAPERINFRPGETSTTRSGSLPASQIKQYVFRAQAGQQTTILLNSPASAANFALQGFSDGIIYKPFSSPAREFSLTLPRTQDYLISINGPAFIDYLLELTVLPLGPTPTPTTPPAAPERINFAPGETSAVRTGALSGAGSKQYVFRALAGQPARILVDSPGAGANFALQGVSDGIVYKPLSNPAREFSLTLPRTQDYLISLSGPAFINYSLELTVQPTGPTSTPPPAPPERISFAPGQSSAVRSGPLYANTPRQFIFGAAAGQTARILLSSPSPAANFSVRGVSDGVTYKSMGDPSREWSFTLPTSQDYLITIQAPVNTSFSLELIIPPATPPTATPTAIAPPTALPTATTPPSATPTLAPTATDMPTSTPTMVPTATETPTVEPTATETATVEPTATATVEPTATDTPTIEPTATETPTLEPTATETPTP
ncbi:MAG TPA: hypothetical protein P5333_15110 [Caldilinea sp.]|mgnify:CR=1 FL=1|nr:hypothetical protein [Caldilinea sp.]